MSNIVDKNIFETSNIFTENDEFFANSLKTYFLSNILLNCLIITFNMLIYDNQLVTQNAIYEQT